MKLLSLLKAVLSQDMNLFKFSTKKNSSKLNKILLPVFLFIIVGLSIGTYAYELGKLLAPLHLTYIMLSIFIMLVTALAFLEGIYKSQGLLFESHDNDLLFSLPIKRSTILFTRIFKLLLFVYLYNLMFILPAFIVYIYFEHPGISFYLISIFMTFLIPIIPTVIASILGYLIKLISSKSKSKRIVQVLLTSILCLGIMYLSMNMDNFFNNIAKNATSINDILTKIYYPIGAYISLIDKFDIMTFIKLLLVNIIPLILFIMIGQKYYFKIISNSKNISTIKKSNKQVSIKTRSKIKSLTLKELKRYFSSPVYMFNTSFGLIIMIVLTIALCLKGKSTIISIFNSYGIEGFSSIDTIFYIIIFFSLAATSITSSSISLEGKTINITKTLPIDYKDIFKSKIINCFIIELPFVLISLLLFIIFYKSKFIFIIELLIMAISIISLSAIVGLLVNLKYPKMNASNDTEVVKQSMSSMISVFTGFGIFLISLLGFGYFMDKVSLNILIIIHLLILVLSSIILYIVLMKKGPDEYQKINV